MVYRIYTEDKNQDSVIIPEVSARFTGFTLIPAVGYWQGIAEKSVIIEVIDVTGVDHEEIKAKLYSVARGIKLLNSQEAVLVTIGGRAELL